MRLITSNDIIGQMARWAVQQHPFNAPEGLFEVCSTIDHKAKAEFKDSAGGLSMQWFKDSGAVRDWVQSAVGEHSALLAWNRPRSGHTRNISISRFDGPAPEDDFIDLDALMINVSRDVWKDAEEFSRDTEAA